MKLEKGKTYTADYWKFGKIKFMVQDDSFLDTVRVKVLDDEWRSNYIKKAIYKINESVVLIKIKIKNLKIC